MDGRSVESDEKDDVNEGEGTFVDDETTAATEGEEGKKGERDRGEESKGMTS